MYNQIKTKMRTKRIMKGFMNATIALLFITLTLSTYGCSSGNGSSGGNSVQSDDKSNGDQGTSVNGVKEDLEKAKKAGNAVFLVITGTGATGVTELLNVANEANKKVKKSTVIQMDKDDAANSDLVTKFGVAGVAVPFVLVISPKGFAVRGFPAVQATPDGLVKSIPSPKYDEILLAINSKKPAFVVAYKQTFADKTGVIAVCKKAVAKVKSTPVIVEIDMDDTNEAGFLSQIGVNTESTTTVIVVINAGGNITGSFTGPVEAQALADAAVKVVKSCCPGGSSSGCNKPCPKK
jgi:hypothetical protein